MKRLQTIKRLIAAGMVLCLTFGLGMEQQMVYAAEINDPVQEEIQQIQMLTDEKCGLEQPEFLESEEVSGYSITLYSNDRTATSSEVEYWKSFNNNYYYNQLSSTEKKVWDELERSCINTAVGGGNADSVMVSTGITGMDSSTLFNLAYRFKLSHPQYFFLKNTFGCVSYSSGESFPYIQIYDEFQDGAVRQNAVRTFTAKIDSLVTTISQQTYDEQKEKAAFDLICNNTVYQSGTYDQSAYSMVCEGKTVCAGYAATLQILLNAVGVDTIEVTGTANGGSHAWNMVKVHDTWYEVDVTFADQNDSANNGYWYGINYAYYNKSKTSFSGDHSVDSMWTNYMPDAKYDSFVGGDISEYENPYFDAEQYTYFKINSNANIGDYYVCAVNSGNNVLPMTVDYEDIIWTVRGGSEVSHVPAAITAQPQSVNGTVGQKVTMSVQTSGDVQSYQWEFRDGNGSWNKSYASGNNTAAISFAVGSEMVGSQRQYRCRIDDYNGNVIYSSAAYVIGSAAPQITGQSQGVTGVVGQKVSMAVECTGDNLSYQWEFRDGNGSWSDSHATGYNSKQISFVIGNEMVGDQRQYRCRITDKNGYTLYSQAAYVKGADHPEITKQPDNVKGTVGQQISMQVQAEGIGLSYQWEFRDGNGAWRVSYATGNKTSKVTFKIGAEMTGDQRQYRCKVTNQNGQSEYSNAAIVYGSAVPVVSSQPKDVKGTVGQMVTIEIKASGDQLKYQWEFRDGNGSWRNSYASGTNSSKITFAVGSEMIGDQRQYRCKITDDNGYIIYSDAATVKGSAVAKVSKQPEDIWGSVGQKVSASISTTGNNLTYQWEFRDGNSQWRESYVGGCHTVNLSFNIGSEMTGDQRQYRCKVTDTNGYAVYSNALTVHAAVGPVVKTNPKNVSGTVGQKVSMQIEAAGVGLTYQWQFRDGNGSWRSSYASGTNSSKITFAVGNEMIGDQRQYRCKVTDQKGKIAYSTVATVNGASVPKVSKQPEDIWGSVGQKVSASISTTGNNLIYQWEFRDGNGQWRESYAGGCHTVNLSFNIGSEMTGDQRQYRCKVTDTNGYVVYSNALTVHAAVGPVVKTNPKNVSGTVGQKVSMQIEAAGVGLTYQWQFRDGNGSWRNSYASGTNSSKITFAVGNEMIGDQRQYRCKVTDQKGNVVYSSNARVNRK